MSGFPPPWYEPPAGVQLRDVKPLSFDRQMVAYADLCDQRIVIDVLDNATQRVARHEAVLFDQMMEQRLVELGWTPPGGKA